MINMKWLPIVLGFLITFSSSIFFETDGLKNYVTTNKTIGCPDDHSTCLTLQEYASQPDKYFTNTTIFYFEPGSHRLNSSLKLTNVHNFTFPGLPNGQGVNISLGSLVTITWEKCW